MAVPTTREPSWRVHTSVLLAVVLLYMATAAWLDLPWWEYAFLSDGSPVAWLSGALLLANAAVALKLTVDGSLPAPPGAALSAALAALALDEQFLLHERLKEMSPSRVADWPTVAVGIGGIVFVAVLWRELQNTSIDLLESQGRLPKQVTCDEPGVYSDSDLAPRTCLAD